MRHAACSGLWRGDEAEKRRLLCLLLVWRCAVSARARRERMLRCLASRDALASRRAELSPAHWRARQTSLWASKALVGFRYLDEQVLCLTIHYEVGKLTRVLCSFLPRLIRRGPCQRLHKQAILKGFSRYFYRFTRSLQHKGVSFWKTPDWLPP